MDKPILRKSKMMIYAACTLFVASFMSVMTVQAGSDYGDFGDNVPTSAQSLVVAGGCFWCIEKDFEKLDSVYEVVSGYAGGEVQNPTYRAHEGHREVVQIYYDPDAITFEELISYYYAHVDYEDGDGQFCDRGRAYTPAIHVKTQSQRQIALNLAPKTSIVPVEDEVKFWPAEQYHQDYYMKNPFRYKFYRASCGRDRRVEQLREQAQS
ncbi:MAG: peptide-methionine (S)-S-oxide reductase MsrA [Candidatus Puniceispirillaceae bacterium]